MLYCRNVFYDNELKIYHKSKWVHHQSKLYLLSQVRGFMCNYDKKAGSCK